MQRLRSVTLNQFLNFAPGTHLTFGDDDNLIIGFSGTGKSTLLNLLARLAYGDVQGIRAIDQNASLTWTWDITYPDGGRATLNLKLMCHPTPWGYLSLSGEVHDRSGDKVLTFNFQGGEADVLYSLLDRSTSLYHNGDRPKRGLGELLTWFAGLDERNPRFDFQDTMYPVLSENTFDQIINSCSRYTSGWPKAPHLEGIPDELGEVIRASDRQQHNLRFNSIISSALGAQAIEFVPKPPEDTGFWYKGFNIYLTWYDGAIQPHMNFSKGQKKVIAHYWASAISPKMPYFAEDLAAGLHPSQAMGACHHLKGRQTFHVVRNPLLLDEIGPCGGVNVIICYRRNCRNVFVRNLSPETMEGFDRRSTFSQSLRDRGIW